MKIRTGFVSNSSSSSFIIDLDVLSPRQIRLIEEHIEHFGEFSHYAGLMDKWDIYELDGKITGTTSMDNFNMESFLKEVFKVDRADIKWEHS